METRDYIEFDVEKMKEAQEVFLRVEQDFRDGVTRFNQIKTKLNLGWQSSGAKEFVNNLNLTWVNNLDKYADVMEHMAGIMDLCILKYSQVEKKANNIYMN